MDDYEIDHEDVIIRLFVRSLKYEAREWFLNLFPKSISSWKEF